MVVVVVVELLERCTVYPLKLKSGVFATYNLYVDKGFNLFLFLLN